MPERFYITTPIYYVNAEPHIGHAYTSIACDTIARYYKNRGEDVFFLTGTDEHGDKIAQAAASKNQTPEEYTNKITEKFKKAWNNLNINYTDFIRTTEVRHKKVVSNLLSHLYARGDIYLGEYDGLYCVGCECFLTDREIDEDKNCLTHKVATKQIREENYFFKMQKYLQPWFEKLQENPDLIYPSQYYNEVLGTIKELQKTGADLSISRPKTRLKWGIDLPFDDKYVTYVWFDALLNYISALDYPNSRFTNYWANAHHMIGKDIIKPHGVYWPTMLLALDIPLFKKILVHGYWLGWGEMKISKSLGNAVDPLQLKNRIGEDQMRYFLMREMIFGSDAKFSEKSIIRRINTDLANDLGNMAQRTLSMAKKYFDAIPEGDHPIVADLEKKALFLIKKYHNNFTQFQFHEAIELVMDWVRNLNKLVEDYAPWKMAKTKDESLGAFLNAMIRGVAFAFTMLQPVLPQKSAEFLSFLEIPTGTFPKSFQEIQIKVKSLENPTVLFPRLEF